MERTNYTLLLILLPFNLIGQALSDRNEKAPEIGMDESDWVQQLIDEMNTSVGRDPANWIK